MLARRSAVTVALLDGGVVKLAATHRPGDRQFSADPHGGTDNGPVVVNRCSLARDDRERRATPEGVGAAAPTPSAVLDLGQRRTRYVVRAVPRATESDPR